MNRQIGVCAIGLVMFGSCANYAFGQTDLSQKADKISWLSGCWTNEDGSTREVWSESFGGLLFGYSVTLKNKKVTFFEELRIERRDSEYVYIASPKGTGTTEFVMTESTEQSARFENPQHDFPQRIQYQRENSELTIDVSSIDQTKGFQLNLRKCQ